jgi:RNA polymerase sigma-70 factor, ECF subfamily
MQSEGLDVAKEDRTEVGDLVARVQSGDREAWNQIVEKFWPSMLIVARKIVSYQKVHVAEEIVQDAFLTAFLRIDTIRDPRRFPAWMKTTVCRMAINCVSRRREDSIHMGHGIGIDDEYSTRMPIDHLIEQERAACIHAGLNQLDVDGYKNDAPTLIKFYWNGLSIKEIAQLDDTASGNVKRRLHFARKRLGERIKEEIFS